MGGFRTRLSLHHVVSGLLSGRGSRTGLFLHQAQQGLLVGLLVVLLAWKGYSPSQAYLVARAIAGGFLLMFISWCVIAGLVCRDGIASRDEYSTLPRRLLLVRPKLLLIVYVVAWVYCVETVVSIFSAGKLDFFMTVCLAVGIPAVQEAAESLVNAIFAPRITPTENEAGKQELNSGRHTP